MVTRRTRASTRRYARPAPSSGVREPWPQGVPAHNRHGGRGAVPSLPGDFGAVLGVLAAPRRGECAVDASPVAGQRACANSAGGRARRRDRQSRAGRGRCAGGRRVTAAPLGRLDRLAELRGAAHARRDPGLSGSLRAEFPSQSSVAATISRRSRRASSGCGRACVSPARTLAACALPALAVSVAWLRIEQPARSEKRRCRGAGTRPGAGRGTEATGARRGRRGASGAAWIAFGAQPWELLPFRDERCRSSRRRRVGRGLADFYRVVLPFSPARDSGDARARPHGDLRLRPRRRAPRRVREAGAAARDRRWSRLAGHPRRRQAVAMGALALAAALSIPLILRVRSAGRSSRESRRPRCRRRAPPGRLPRRRRARGRAGLGELGLLRGACGGDGRQIRMGLELRRHRVSRRRRPSS